MAQKKKPTPLWVIKVRKYLPWIIGVGLLIAFYFGGIIAQSTGAIMGFESSKIHFGPIHCLLANFKYGFHGFFLVLALYGALAFYIIRLYKDKTARELSSDERGFETDASGTYGTAQLMNYEDCRNYVEIEPLEKTKGMIVGKFCTLNEDTGSPQKVVSIPPDGKRYVYDKLGKPVMERKDGQLVQKREKLVFNGNRHVMVIGPSGAGKSFCFSMPNIFNSINNGESLIITDPKGELYNSTSEYAKDHGYVVKVLNFANPQVSDSWDVLGEISGEQISIKAQEFTNIIIENTEDEGTSSEFKKPEANLLTALVLYMITTPNPPYPRTIGGVYKLLCEPLKELDLRFEALELIQPGNPALANWSTFKDGSEAYRGNVRSGLGNRLQTMNDEVIQLVTGTPDVDLTLPGKTKCAYYVVISDMNNTFKFLSSLFFTYLFNKLVDYSRRQPSEKLHVPVNVIMDEFIAIGRIPDIDKKLATVRSAGINISMIFQTLAQLQAEYPNGLWETLISNCSTMLVLACNDLTTAKYLSDRGGTATVALDQVRVERPVIALGQVPTSMAHSYSLGKRQVLDLSEVIRLDPEKVLISINSANLFLAQRFPATDIVDLSAIRKVNVFDHSPDWQRERNYTPTTVEKQPTIKYEGIYHTPSSSENNSTLKKENDGHQPMSVVTAAGEENFSTMEDSHIPMQHYQPEINPEGTEPEQKTIKKDELEDTQKKESEDGQKKPVSHISSCADEESKEAFSDF